MQYDVQAMMCVTNQICKVVCYDCGPNPLGCHHCVPTDGSCLDTMIGMIPKDPNSNGNFSVPVSPPLVPGHFVYCSDGCNDPNFQAGIDVVVQAAPVAPLLSPQMIILLAAALGLVGRLGLARMRLNN